jgi:histidine triad (HIT) family protein
MTIFEKIVAREISARIIFEDKEVLAFHDVRPQAPIHVLIIPKKHVSRIAQVESDDAALLGKLLLTARDLAQELGIAQTGFRLVINNGPNGGETVSHLHVHLLGGRPMAWPPG